MELGKMAATIAVAVIAFEDRMQQSESRVKRIKSSLRPKEGCSRGCSRIRTQDLAIICACYDLILRPSASFISELSMTGNPLFARPPVQLILSPGFTRSRTQPYDLRWFRLIISMDHSSVFPL